MKKTILYHFHRRAHCPVWWRDGLSNRLSKSGKDGLWLPWSAIFRRYGCQERRTYREIINMDDLAI